MKLFLVRHGETNANKEGILQGDLDTELSDLGATQAEKLALRLKDFMFDYVYSSDLKRAHVTTEFIMQFHDGKIIFDRRLRERNFGDFTGKKSSEVGWDALKGEPWDKAPPHGESIKEHLERVRKFVRELPENGNILIVCHGGTLRSFLQIFLEKSFEEISAMSKPKNAGLYIIAKTSKGFELLVENSDEHLM